MTTPISVVLVDETPRATEGVVALLRAQPGFVVLAASAEIRVALEKVRETTPAVVLLNLRQEGDGCLTLAGALHGEVPESRVIVLGLEPAHADPESFIRAGVSGFIVAGASFDEFLCTLRAVARGERVLPAGMTHSLFGQLNRQRVPRRSIRGPRVKRFTNRDKQVADLIAMGMANKEIAARLRIASRTVTDHVHKVLASQAVNGRLEVAACAELTPACDR